MVNDLLQGCRRVKYVDDTVTWERCPVTGRDSRLQAIADETDAWLVCNGMQLNVDKTKELIVSFSRKYPPDDIPSITITDKELERITCANVQGVYISSDLSWRSHVDYICPSVSKRLYFLSVLKRAGASQWDLLMFYKAAVRSVVEYACVVWHMGLTDEQSNSIQSIQKRALGIILPDVSYEYALVQAGLETLHTRREKRARSFYQRVQEPSHNYIACCGSLDAQHRMTYELQKRRIYPAPGMVTDRAKNAFIIYGMSYW